MDFTKLIPFPSGLSGLKRPEFYHCKCTKCGYSQGYEVSNCDVISIGDDNEGVSTYIHVTELPQNCPKCGAKLSKEKVPSPLKY